MNLLFSSLSVCSHVLIDTFAHQQANLETSLKNLSQAISKLVDRNRETYEQDLQKVSGFLTKLHAAFLEDKLTSGLLDSKENDFIVESRAF